MKRTLLLAAGLALTLLTGCVVTSVYPYYTPKDVTFDPALLGVWSDPAETNTDKETWTFEKSDAQTYKLTVHDKDKDSEYDTHLFKLGGQLFLDSLPRERHDYTTPTHVLLHVSSLQPKLEMHLLNYEWLGKLVETDPKAIRHIVTPKPTGDSKDDGLLVLTADTAELQKFVTKHLKTEGAWSDALVMKKR